MERLIAARLLALVALVSAVACSGGGDSLGESLRDDPTSVLRVATIDVIDVIDADSSESYRFSWDESGALVEVSGTSLADGEAFSRTEYVIENGRLIGTRVDDGVDGTIDRVTRYEYDGGPRIVRLLEDQGNDGSVDSVTTFSYGAGGALDGSATDTDNDGALDLVRTFELDGAGRPLGGEIDIGADGTIDRRIEPLYSPDGLLSELYFVGSEDGERSSLWRYRYELGPCRPDTLFPQVGLRCIERSS